MISRKRRACCVTLRGTEGVAENWESAGSAVKREGRGGAWWAAEVGWLALMPGPLWKKPVGWWCSWYHEDGRSEVRDRGQPLK